ncbi:DUF4396 domain-containing protein [Methanoculleus sp.]|uniref:DUF4396 domain-containing protein n=1 Tax=Methanoculleus sp. TaxID=90427 RepID=UPI0025F82E78|nr:DUF4396 domain-containing protein [Methanoculleus sp.]
MERIFEFPSLEAARQFAEDVRPTGWRVEFPAGAVARIFTRRMAGATAAGLVIGAAVLGLLGWLADAGLLGLDRFEPLFAAPYGTVTVLFATVGAALGGLAGTLATLEAAPMPPAGETIRVTVQGDGDAEQLMRFARRYGGTQALTGGESRGGGGHGHDPDRLTPLRLAAWVALVVVAGIILAATSYIWILSAAYGPGSDQESRVGWTLKNAQRIPGDTPEAVGASMAEILGGTTMPAPTDPLAAAILAPVAAREGRTLVYGGAAGPPDLDALSLEGLERLADSRDVVVVAREEPAYAMPAAYAAAQFGAPLVVLDNGGGVPGAVRDALAAGGERRFYVAAPSRLVPDETLDDLRQYGTVERVAAENIYLHALTWARGRWDDFGWGMQEIVEDDGYYYYAMANPADPGFAAAGLPMAYLGNYGPLLYTPHDDLDPLTDQYLWRVSPDFFVSPADGPFMNVRVLGSPESVSYAAQARADLALETHEYWNQVTGASGLALLGWSWFVAGAIGAVWALLVMPARLPGTGFYPRLYWPLAILMLGPAGILAFFGVYSGAVVTRSGPMPRFLRPPWSRALSATIMGISVGMALMVASMWAVQLALGMPLVTAFSYTWWYWLGAPMSTAMWWVMVIPAIILSTLLYMGPMMAEQQGSGYLSGVRRAAPVVIVSMITASAGMWGAAWYLMAWEGQMAAEDLWLWIVPIWAAIVVGLVTAYVPNYLMVKAGWKEGGM